MMQEKITDMENRGISEEKQGQNNFKNSKKKNQSFLNWGLQIKKGPASEWPSLKSLQITNAKEGVEKRGPSYTVDGNASWCSHYGEHYGGSSEN